MSQHNIVDLILIDHRKMKECIHILKNEDSDKREKLRAGKEFLEVLAKHAKVEEAALYEKVKDLEDVHKNILEGYEEHSIADAKLHELKPRLAQLHSLNEEIEVKLKVLGELVEHHMKEEESELLPRLKNICEEKELFKMGEDYLDQREFTEEDLEDTPILKEEIAVWSHSVVDMSKRFTEKAEKYIQSLGR